MPAFRFVGLRLGLRHFPRFRMNSERRKDVDLIPTGGPIAD